MIVPVSSKNDRVIRGIFDLFLVISNQLLRMKSEA